MCDGLQNETRLRRTGSRGSEAASSKATGGGRRGCRGGDHRGGRGTSRAEGPDPHDRHEPSRPPRWAALRSRPRRKDFTGPPTSGKRVPLAVAESPETMLFLKSFLFPKEYQRKTRSSRAKSIMMANCVCLRRCSSQKPWFGRAGREQPLILSCFVLLLPYKLQGRNPPLGAQLVRFWGPSPGLLACNTPLCSH